MKELKNLENSRGVCLFAFNTEQVNYLEIALKTTQLIKKFLQLPVCIITDQEVIGQNVDYVIKTQNTFSNFKTGALAWRNGDRYKIYDLTPFDETILLDSDYLILDKNLLKLFELDLDYKMFYKSHFLNDISSEHIMGSISLPFIWATTIVFKKTVKSYALFTLVNKIQNNYDFYRQLFNIQGKNYRNDFAFTIANHVINGYCLDPRYNIPWSLITVDRKVESIEIMDNKVVIRNADKCIISPLQSLHILDKEYLMSDNFKTLVDKLCQDQ